MKYSKNFYFQFYFLFILLCILTSSLQALEHEMGAEVRVRGEIKDNAGFTALGRTGSIGERARVHLKFKADEVEAFIEPEFSKIFGQDTTLVTGATQETSGTNFDTDLSVHQAYFSWMPWQKMSLHVGRQELAYGDHLIIGNNGWSNIGRSFDAVKLHFLCGDKGWTDVFYASISDQNVTAGGAGDYDFLGIYHHYEFGGWFKNFEPYVLYNADFRGTGDADSSLVVFGTRLKSSIEDYDYRLEVTAETGKESGTTLTGIQGDLEVGYTKNTSRIGLEYFIANDEYRQLFPTTHRWLGHMDVLGRRNIQGGVIHLKHGLMEKLSINLDGHFFLRVQDDEPVYSTNATTTIGTGIISSSLIAGNEEDLYASYRYNDNFSIDAGASLFVPLSYIKDEVGDELATFYYLQGTVYF